MLHARSRHVPVALAALAAATVLVWFSTRWSWSPLLTSLAITSLAALASGGLGGQDVDLDRTAAIRWPLRRFGHLCVIGLVVAGAVLAVQQGADGPVATGLVLRNTAGTLGLTAIAATVFGGGFGWTLPLAWLAITPFVPAHPDTTSQVAAWMLRPAGSTEATVTAAALCAAGVLLYSVVGARRASG